MTVREIQYIGIDGEGQGRNPHNYFMLAASDELGNYEWVLHTGVNEKTKQFNNRQLSTVECLDHILTLPDNKNTKIFSYSFNYDLTKILTDLDNESLYKLFRPELRPSMVNHKFGEPGPVEWPRTKPKYALNLLGTKFKLKCLESGKTIIIWDLIKFFQSKFVNALRDWKVGSPELWERMQRMKDKRNEFDVLDAKSIVDYCLEETRCIAGLARKLTEAHEKADLKLKNYYGAGSSGAAMLDSMGIKQKLHGYPIQMAGAVASSFFGGRFENSVIGSVLGELEGKDISSAYVYQLAFLPCMEHCKWKHITKRKDLEVQVKNGALVRYSLGRAARNPIAQAWGPFPFRSPDGSISYPIESGGGWVWVDEYLAGERLYSNVQFKEAWLYRKYCDCKPFAKIPEYYMLRLLIGKEGPGLVIKLGMNSCYGKLAQSVGTATYNSWLWASMITSGTRAQLLEVLGLHENPANVLMMATDGIVSREKIQAPKPLFTATGNEKPLGGWETKSIPNGMFFGRPGIYFPMNPTAEQLQQIRARGIGRAAILDYWKDIVGAWERIKNTGNVHEIRGQQWYDDDKLVRVKEIDRFCGAKTSLSFAAKGTNEVGVPVGRYNRATGKQQLKLFESKQKEPPSYGQWIKRPIEMCFDPMPKREGVNKDGQTLTVRKFPRDLESLWYGKVSTGEIVSPEAVLLRTLQQELSEQPDVDYADFGAGDE